MGVEIERKFLVASQLWKAGAEGVHYQQGYLCRGRGRTVRVRTAGQNAFLTIKGPSSGASRPEFEYPIPLEDAQEMLRLCEGALIDKTRYRVGFEGHTWEVDEFHGDNTGLVLAEVELSQEYEHVSIPPWIGEEVTADPRYFNSNLSIHPFKAWLE